VDGRRGSNEGEKVGKRESAMGKEVELRKEKIKGSYGEGKEDERMAASGGGEKIGGRRRKEEGRGKRERLLLVRRKEREAGR